MNFSPVFNLQKEYEKYQNVIKDAQEGEFVTRFPPEPSGYLHIGHVKASMINYHYAKIYKGKMIFRFDDTNPTKEKEEYSQSIFEDLKTLGINYDKFTHSSDYFITILEYAEKIIKKGLAFCDNTDKETMQKERFDKVDSKNRNNSVEENLRIFEELKKLTVEIPAEKVAELKKDPSYVHYPDYCIRAKIDMKSVNGTMRDPVIFRINFTPHPRQDLNYAYKLYPTYDFTCPIVDSLEGVTHAMRTNEYSDRIEQYYWFIKVLELRPVKIWEFSRLNMVNTVMSKRKLQWFVEQKLVDGWTDPRFPTVRGILRRGLRVETLTQFMLEQGPSKNSVYMEWDKLWSINKSIIDPISKRYSAVSCDQTCTIYVENGPEKLETFETEHNANLPLLGQKDVYKSKNVIVDYKDASQLEIGSKVTLLKWGNVIIKDKQPDGEGLLLTAEYLPDDKDFKSTLKFTWLSKDSPLTRVTIVEYDHLINVKKVDDDMKFEDCVNPQSKFTSEWFADPAVRALKENDFFQFERLGYFRVDRVSESAAPGAATHELIFIPDGKSKSMSGVILSVDPQTTSKGTGGQEKKTEEVKEEQADDGKEEKQNNQTAPKKEKEKKEKLTPEEIEQKQKQRALKQAEKANAAPAETAEAKPDANQDKQKQEKN